MGTLNLRYAVFPGCLVHGDFLNPCKIFLPHPVPLETFEDPLNLPTGIWPATFLCSRHGTTCVCNSHDVRHEIDLLDQGQPTPNFWEIECECAHENCGSRHTIYTGEMPDSARIRHNILKLKPTIPCGSPSDPHNLVWQWEKILPREIL